MDVMGNISFFFIFVFLEERITPSYAPNSSMGVCELMVCGLANMHASHYTTMASP